MGNMIYCQFRNTKFDFEQCLDAIGNAESLDDFSQSEKEYAQALRDLAEQYISWYDQLEVESQLNEEED